MKRLIEGIVIHCSATENGKDIRAKDIDAMHAARGFKRDSQACRNFNPELKSIGYHFFIDIDGTVETGRSIEEIGAGVEGHNAHTIHICMAGTDSFCIAQWFALRDCVIKLAGTIRGKVIMTAESAIFNYNDMGISIKGHRDYSPDLNKDGVIQPNEWIKRCPCFEVKAWVKGGMMPLVH